MDVSLESRSANLAAYHDTGMLFLGPVSRGKLVIVTDAVELGNTVAATSPSSLAMVSCDAHRPAGFIDSHDGRKGPRRQHQIAPMPYPQFDRHAVKMLPLSTRVNKNQIERDHVPVDASPQNLSDNANRVIAEAVERIVQARENGAPVILTFGAHSIKNGLALVMIELMEAGWVTHLATNGAGIIHDWEFAFQGQSSEDVEGYVKQGQFGNWEETGRNINLALNVGAYEGKGYGESVGAFIQNEGADIPDIDTLREEVAKYAADDPARAAAAADMLAIVATFNLPAGRLEVPHAWNRFSVQAAAFRLGVPSTGHPMFGHDIIYNHPMNHGASVGRTAERDFLTFAESVSRIDGGVYLSIGSAVMSPMVFEKSLSISQNLAIQRGSLIENHSIYVVDLAESHWDWTQGEPPVDNPDYYLRYNKSFNRMGGQMRYLTADNRDFLLELSQSLRGHTP